MSGRCSMPGCGLWLQAFPSADYRYCPRCDRRKCDHCPEPVADWGDSECVTHKGDS